MPFAKGKSGNPKGKPRGAKDKRPRSARAAVNQLLDDYGMDVSRIKAAIDAGLDANPPHSLGYVKMVVEHQVGQPEQTVNVPGAVTFVIQKQPGADCRD